MKGKNGRVPISIGFNGEAIISFRQVSSVSVKINNQFLYIRDASCQRMKF